MMNCRASLRFENIKFVKIEIKKLKILRGSKSHKTLIINLLKPKKSRVGVTQRGFLYSSAT